MTVPLPTNEAARIAALRAEDILDSPAERAFDDIVRLAQVICAVPIALVTLVDADRQWFKARIGMPLTETPRDQSFCAHALGSHAPFVIEDTEVDPRFADNPLVRDEPRIRSYVGVPIYAEEGGAALGTLCVLDRVPRKLSNDQLVALTALARRVEVELRLRKRALTTRSDPPARPARGAAPGTTESRLSDGDLVGGRYRIERLIGAGGMGRVYLAADTKAGQLVALKVMGSMAVSTNEAVERFAREAKALLRVRSAHVAQLLDAGNLDDGGAPFLVMEYLEGHDLAHAHAPMSVELVTALALQVCDGVAAVHEAGVVHRDLKPSNLFLVRSGDEPTVKVLDFGIAKLTATVAAPLETTDPLAPDGSLTHAATMLGSPRYMSPEQLLSSRDVDASTDIWALGVIFYELLTQEHPFDGTSITEICASVFMKKPRSMRDRMPAIPAALDDLVLRCVAREKNDRWLTARALQAALASWR